MLGNFQVPFRDIPWTRHEPSDNVQRKFFEHSVKVSGLLLFIEPSLNVQRTFSEHFMKIFWWLLFIKPSENSQETSPKHCTKVPDCYCLLNTQRTFWECTLNMLLFVNLHWSFPDHSMKIPWWWLVIEPSENIQIMFPEQSMRANVLEPLGNVLGILLKHPMKLMVSVHWTFREYPGNIFWALYCLGVLREHQWIIP